jgi:hypothetical protein
MHIEQTIKKLRWFMDFLFDHAGARVIYHGLTSSS